MDSTRRSYVLVGLFVILILAGLMYSLVRLSGWGAETDPYFTVFPNVTGINTGTKVLYEGFDVGRVTGVRVLTAKEASELRESPAPISHTLFRLDFEVEKGWPIPADATAEITAPGFLAAVVVSITEPTGDVAPSVSDVPIGGYVTGRQAESILRTASELASSFQSLTDTARATLVERIDPAIDDFRLVTQELARDIPPMVDRANAFVDKIHVIADELRGFTTEENRERLERLLAQLTRAGNDINRFTGKLDKLADSANELIASNRENVEESISSFRYVMDSLARDIDEVNRNIEGASRNMHEFSRQIRQNPGVLLGGTSRRANDERR